MYRSRRPHAREDRSGHACCVAPTEKRRERPYRDIGRPHLEEHYRERFPQPKEVPV